MADQLCTPHVTGLNNELRLRGYLDFYSDAETVAIFAGMRAPCEKQALVLMA